MAAAAPKTLLLSFRQSKLEAESLRCVPRKAWESVCRLAGCGELRSVVESASAELPVSSKKEGKHRISTKGLTAYLAMGASLVLSDTTLTLKTSDNRTPMLALEAILDLVVPTWRTKCPEQYLKLATYSHLGESNGSESNVETQLAWAKEIERMREIFRGDAVTLGSDKTWQKLFIANYVPKGEVVDIFSTQVSLTRIDASEAAACFGKSDGPGVLSAAWAKLHGAEPRSIASQPNVDDCSEDGYLANAVYGRHFTMMQTAGGAAGVATSLPMSKEARLRFVHGARGLCSTGSVAVAELALNPSLFIGGEPLDLPGLVVLQTSRVVHSRFACALHVYGPAPATSLSNRSLTLSQCSSMLSPTTSPDLFCSPMPRMLEMEALERLSDAAENVQGLGVPSTTLQRIDASKVEEASGKGAEFFLASRPEEDTADLPVVLLDLGALKRQADVWARELPRVEPFYAVKCNSHERIVATLWEHWAVGRAAGAAGGHTGGFDCASPSEMQAVKVLDGLDPSNHIVYANPCKQGSAVEFARANDVTRVVFDNSAELDKLNKLHPHAELLLRVQTDDSLAQCPLSNKFGASVTDSGALLAKAISLGLHVVGVSFHVGSGCSQLGAFRSALTRARAVWDEAEAQGLTLKLLDIGGGFPGWDEPGEATFADHAQDICSMLEEHFPSPMIRVIAEPGRFFAAQSQSVLTTVISVADSEQGFRYYLNDGVYGSFNCLVYDHAAVPMPQIMRDGKVVEMEGLGDATACTVFGPTCDGFDVISEKLELPRLQVGDRLLFANMGAYTSSASTSFNGFAPASSFIYESVVAE